MAENKIKLKVQNRKLKEENDKLKHVFGNKFKKAIATMTKYKRNKNKERTKGKQQCIAKRLQKYAKQKTPK